MAASDPGTQCDDSMVGGLLHRDGCAFFPFLGGGATALGCAFCAFGAYDKFGVISHPGVEFLVFTTFLLGYFFFASYTQFSFPSIFVIYYLGIFYYLHVPGCNSLWLMRYFL